MERGFALEVTLSADTEQPLFFTWRGRCYQVHSILTRWRKAGEWWQRITNSEIDDGSCSAWRVEAAPEGSLTVFDLERDDASGLWRVTVR